MVSIEANGRISPDINVKFNYNDKFIHFHFVGGFLCVCVSLSLYSTKMANPILSVRHIDDDFNKKQQTRLYHTLCDFHIIED